MKITYEVDLISGVSPTVQLFQRVGNLPVSGLIVGIADNVESFVYRFDLTGVALGDYLCQLSGVSNPNARPYPLRILGDGVFHADDWRAMDKLYPEKTTMWELHWLRMKATGATHQDIALRWIDLHPDPADTLKDLIKRSKNEVGRQKRKAGMA